MKTINRRLAVGLATGVIAVGLIVPAVAQDTSETPTEDATTEDAVADDASDRPDRSDHAEREAAFAAALAGELGLDETTVADAIDTVHETLRAEHDAERAAALHTPLDEAVAAGELTQAQADVIAAAVAEGVRVPHGGRDGDLATALDEAVAAGELTQAQADAFAAAAAAGLFVGHGGRGPGGGGPGGHHGRGPGGFDGASDATVDDGADATTSSTSLNA